MPLPAAMPAARQRIPAPTIFFVRLKSEPVADIVPGGGGALREIAPPRGTRCSDRSDDNGFKDDRGKLFDGRAAWSDGRAAWAVLARAVAPQSANIRAIAVYF